MLPAGKEKNTARFDSRLPFELSRMAGNLGDGLSSVARATRRSRAFLEEEEEEEEGWSAIFLEESGCRLRGFRPRALVTPLGRQSSIVDGTRRLARYASPNTQFGGRQLTRRRLGPGAISFYL
ncbi:hypothetical protein KM043_000529 [Ampulex compressa]|nr:hypothetical protein KM043_000529 [Ampulex compressa]